MPAAVCCRTSAPHPYIQWVRGALGMRAIGPAEYTPDASSALDVPGTWVEYIRSED